MVEQYGDSYEKHTYIGKERYTIYRYALGECFHEFGIPGKQPVKSIMLMFMFPVRCLSMIMEKRL